MPESKPRRVIQVVDYDAAWPRLFEQLREHIWPHVQDVALAIEHVGSTAVPGLAAKPIIDLDVIIPARETLPAVIERLAELGYVREGNLGFADRDAFAPPPDAFAHHLYVCPRGTLALRNHLAVRDYLRAHPQDAAAYGALKKQLAERFTDDIKRYIAGKDAFVLSVLAKCSFSEQELDQFRGAGRAEADGP
jgi:GrpB-like predicted nucleotidyltransferase (UPF0157 family)